MLTSLIKHLKTSKAAAALKAVPDGLHVVIKMSMSWPYANRMPGLDLLRLLTVAPATATYVHPRGSNLVEMLIDSVSETAPAPENNVMLASRAFSNLFESTEGRNLAAAQFDKIQAFTAAIIDAGTSNRNVLVAVTTLYINYSVLLGTSSDSSSIFESAAKLLETLTTIASTQGDSEVVYRALVAIGTLLGLADEVKAAAKEVYDVDKTVNVALGKASDPRIKNVVAEIKALLK